MSAGGVVENLARRWLLGCLLLAGFASGAAQIELGNYEIVSRTRVDRFAWEYVMRATAQNTGAAAVGVTATLTGSGPVHTVVEGSLGFGDLGAGASGVSLDTFTLRVDRQHPFDPAALEWEVIFDDAVPRVLEVDITSPTDGLLTRLHEVSVEGTIGEGVTSVSVNGVAATLAEGRFTARVPIREGRNPLTATARGDRNAEGRDTVVVRVDTQAPLLNIEMPRDGQTFSESEIAVTGLVNDIVAGTVNEADCTVLINGVRARISNRSYEAQGVLLALGQNTISAVAIDAAGNETLREITVTYRPPAEQQTLRIASGNFQEGAIGTLLGQPLVVEVLDGIGNPIEDQLVVFQVARNDGVLVKEPLRERQIAVLTDANGLASVQFQMGSRTGAGNNQVAVTAPGFDQEVIFCSSALPGPANRLAPLNPETQVGTAGQPLPLPWSIYVVDAGGNPVEGVDVAFVVTEGDGNVDGEGMVTLTTDANGRAAVTHTLGPDAGIYNNVLIAAIVGATGPDTSTVFKATSKLALGSADTRVSGLILDHVNRPMANVYCHIEHTSLETVTDEQGLFSLSNVPVGPVRLLVDARGRGFEGEWHMLEFDLVTVAGQDNQVDRPIYMLPLDVENSAVAGGDEDVVLHMKDIPGATVTIHRNSVHGPDGERQMRVLWTQVNMERVPMPPPLGSQFMLAWTIQPAGIHFDPPVSICIPNMGSPPGQVVEIFSFDHDVAEFVAVGTATVTPDGAQMCSDPGFGVMKSGWGGCVPPPPPCSPVCGPAPRETECVAWQRVAPASRCDCPTYRPVFKTSACDDGNDCTINDRCQRGVCRGDPVTVTAVTGPCVAAVGSAVTFTATSNAPDRVKWSAPGGTPSSGTGGSFTTTFAGETTSTVVASCGSSSRGKQVVAVPACATIVARLNEEEVNQAPNPGNFGQVHRLSHSAVYRGCAEGGRWCFRLETLTERHGIGTSLLGRTDISGAGDADITPASCQAVIRDLTPVGGAAPYATYVPDHIVLAHERFHVDDFRNRVVTPTMNDLATFVARPANCTDCRSAVPAAFNPEMERIWNGHRPSYFDGNHETRAYAAENALLANLVAGIRARARAAPAAEGWPAACQ